MLATLHTILEKILPRWMHQRLIGDWDPKGFKKYLKNTGWMLFARVGGMFVSLLTTFFIARQLGPANYGELSYAVSFVGLFSFIAYLGIDSVLYRELIKYPEKRNEFMGSALIIRIIASIIAIFITVFSAFFFSQNDVSFHLIILLSLGFIFQSFNIIGYEFQASVQIKSISILSFLITVILNILKITVIVLGGGVIYLALVLLLESVLYMFGSVYLRYKVFGSLSMWKFDKNILKRILIDSWPFIFTGALTVIYTRIDQVMLKNIVDAYSVGIYDAAVRLSELWYFIPGILVASLFPAIVNSRIHSPGEYKKRTLTLFFLLLGLASSIAIIISIFAQPIVSLIFGQDFQASVIILQIYIWTLIPSSLIILLNYILLAENAKKTLFLSALLGMCVNVYLNSLLIPTYQAKGAAIATLISSSVILMFFGFVFVFVRKNNFNYK